MTEYVDTALAIALECPYRSTDMVITILEAPVAPERWDALRDAEPRLTIFKVWANPRAPL